MMRIVQMLDSLNWGGAQKMQHFLVETLRPLGIEITVISLRTTSNSTVEADLLAAGAKVVAFPFPKLFSPGSFIALVKYLRREKFDLLHTYLTYSNIVGSLAGWMSGIPVIASLRNADFEFKGYSFQREILERLAMQYLAKRVMANGNMVGEFARKRLGAQAIIDIIPNAVDSFPPLTDVERHRLRAELMGDPGRVLILSVGRLAPLKGYPDLIEAFAVVSEKFPQATLMVAGGGKIQDELQARIDALHLTDRVRLLGVRNDVRTLLYLADIYVNSSHWEGTPVSVLEAMATGLPIVATRVGENPYLLADGAGLLVEPKRPTELAGALISLLSSSVQCTSLSTAALKRVKEVYSRSVWCRKMLELYQQVTPAATPYLMDLVENGE